MNEDRVSQLKRLRMRSWRRGTKEMDLIVGPFADSQLADLNSEDLVTYESLLEENDQDLYQWVSGQADAPVKFAKLIQTIRSDALDSAGKA